MSVKIVLMVLGEYIDGPERLQVVQFQDETYGIWNPETSRLQHSLTHTQECSSVRWMLRHYCKAWTRDGIDWMNAQGKPSRNK